MGLTKKEESEIDRKFENLINLTKVYADESIDNLDEKRFKIIRSRLISLKIRLHIEKKDTQKKQSKRFRK